MRILFIRDFFDYGGASKMIISVASAMVDYGHEVYVYAYGSVDCPLVIDSRIKFIQGTPYANSRVLRHPMKIGEIRKAIKNVRPDLVVTFLPYPSILTILARVGLHIPVVVSERGDPAIYKGFIRYIGHKIISKADGAVFQTEGAREFYIGTQLFKKSTIIPNAVTIMKTKRLTSIERKKEIAFVGRFQIVQKRQDVMIDALKIIVSKHPDYILSFYGSGEDENKIRRLVIDNDLSENVLFHGAVSPIEDFIKDKMIYVLTSDYEGIPNSLMEAMCLGLPCISTDCTPGGARLLISNKENGLLVPRDDAKAVAEACCELIEHPDMADKIGENAQKICDLYAPSVIYEKWNCYLEQIVNKE